jgi:flagellar hook-length control protein FliK
MPSHSEISSLLSLNPRGADHGRRESQPVRSAGDQEFRRLLEKPQDPPLDARPEPRAAERGPRPEEPSPRPQSGDRPSSVRPQEPTQNQDKAPQAAMTIEATEAQALPVELDLSDPLNADTTLEALLEELLQWIDVKGAGELETEEGKEQLQALLSQLGVDVPEDQLPALMAQINTVLSSRIDPVQRDKTGERETMQRLKALLAPHSPTSGDRKTTGEGSALEAGKGRGLGEALDFGQVIKASTKGDMKAAALADGAAPKPESAVVQTVLGAEPNTRGAQLQPGERSFIVQPEVRVPVGQSQWGRAVGERVLWLAAQNITSAELRLDPPDLGPVQVRVTMHNDQVNVTFTSNQIAVREALDQSAQRLRDMFSEQGLNLGDVNVSDQSDDREFAQGDHKEGQGESAHSDEDVPQGQAPKLSLHLVDSYV